jgi:hypothetical protein
MADDADNPFAKYVTPAAEDDNPFAKYAAPSVLESIGRGGLEGATFGWESELGLADQARQEASRRANPWSHFAGEMIGGFAPMGIAAVLPGGQVATAGRLAQMGYRASNLARGALLPGDISTLGRAAAQGAKLGAVYGTASGAGHTDVSPNAGTIQALAERGLGGLRGGIVGTVIGAPTGGALYGGSRLIGATINRTMPGLAQAIEAARHPEAGAFRDILRNMGYDRISAEDLQALRTALADPANAGRFEGLNLIEALQQTGLAQRASGELYMPPRSTINLQKYQQDVANTPGTGMQEAREAFVGRQSQMRSALEDDVERAFGAPPASRTDDVANLSAAIDRVTGSGNRAAVEAQRVAQREAFNKRYERLRERPLMLNEGLGDTLHIPQMQKALQYAAENDMINAPAGTSWGRSWANWLRSNAQGFDERPPVPGITLSPANVMDIYHVLAVNAKPPLGQITQESMQAGNLKRRFGQWVDERLRGHKNLSAEYAMFKRAMEAEEMGAALPLVGGGRNHASMQFLNSVNADAQKAANDIGKLLPSADRSLAAYQAGALRNAPALDALRKAEAKAATLVEVRDSFRRAWGEGIKEQLERTTDPQQVARLVNEALSPAGRERIAAVLGPRQGLEFIQELTTLAARNYGLTLGLSRGGSDAVAMQFLAQMQREGNTAAIEAFRRAWGSKIRDDLGATQSPAAVNAIVNNLLTPEGKRRILSVLGETRGRAFIESLYNKQTQGSLGNRIYGNSDTAYKLGRLSRMGAIGEAGVALSQGHIAGVLNALRRAASLELQQRRADQANRLLSRQGVPEVQSVIDAILARQQLRTTGHPYLVRPALPAIGPGASYLPTTYERRRP